MQILACPVVLHGALPWRRARDNGLNAAAAAHAVGVSQATLYRWRKLRDQGRLAPRSRRRCARRAPPARCGARPSSPSCSDATGTR